MGNWIANDSVDSMANKIVAVSVSKPVENDLQKNIFTPNINSSIKVELVVEKKWKIGSEKFGR